MADPKSRTRLVMIQGDKAALYEGKEQLVVFDGAAKADAELVERVRRLPRGQAAQIKKEAEDEFNSKKETADEASQS